MAKKLDTAPFYRRIIMDAGRISWHHKHLWIFGFFATLTGFGGVTEMFFSGFDRASVALPTAAAGGGLSALIPGLTTVRAVAAFSPYPVMALALFGLIFTLLAAVLVWISITSVGGLLANVRKISRGGEPTFGDGLRSGSQSFWRLLGIFAIAKLAVFAALFVAGSNLFALLRDGYAASGLLFYVGAFVMLIAVSFVAALVEIYASNSAVVKQTGVKESIAAAFAVIRGHWLVHIEMALLLLVSCIAVALTAAIAVMVISVPLIFMIAVASAAGAMAAVYAIYTLTALMLVVTVAVLGAFLTSLQASAWMLLWSEMAERKPAALIHRMEHHVRSRRA